MLPQVLKKSDLGAWIAAMATERRVAAPVLKETSPADRTDLKFGWETIVDPDDVRLDYSTTVLGPKKFIWPSRQMSPRLFNRMLAVCQARSFTPDIVVEVAAVDVAYSLVAAGMGVALVITAHPGREPTDVALRRIEDFDVPMPLSMIWRRNNSSPVLANFVLAVGAAQAEAGAS